MKKNLTKILYAAVMLSMSFCSDSNRVAERPKKIVPTGPRAEIYEKIMAQFPEGVDIKTSQQALFDAGAQKRVILTAESAIYVTFISEGASFPNSFGFYTYNINDTPASAEEIDVQILFPHVNKQVLDQGDRLQLGEGTFPAGTVVGFFLIIRGWEHGTINYDRETFYTDSALNPDQQQQHVLFKQKDLGDIVLTFEDQLTSSVSDKDYNDIIFLVSDNTEEAPVTRFDTSNVPEL